MPVQNLWLHLIWHKYNMVPKYTSGRNTHSSYSAPSELFASSISLLTLSYTCRDQPKLRIDLESDSP